MIVDAWLERYQERTRTSRAVDIRIINSLSDFTAVIALLHRLEYAHKSGDTASTRRWLHAVQVAIAACAPSRAEGMRLALGDVVGLLGLDDTHTKGGLR